jgi:hypothetical protein
MYENIDSVPVSNPAEFVGFGSPIATHPKMVAIQKTSKMVNFNQAIEEIKLKDTLWK